MSTDDEAPRQPADGGATGTGPGDAHDATPPPAADWRTQPPPPLPQPWQVGEELPAQAPYAPYPSTAAADERFAGDGRTAPRDGFSITAFVTGLLGLVVVSVILAIVGLARTSGGRRRGRGFAVAGLVLSVLWAAAIAVAVPRLVNRTIAPVPTALPIAVQPSPSPTTSKAAGSPTTSPSPSARPSPTPSATPQVKPVPARKTYVDDLRTGDCLVTAGLGTSVLKVPVVPCRQAHDAEMVGVASLPGRWHGEAALQALGDKTCGRLFASYVGVAEDSSQYAVGWFGPTAESWQQGDRRVVCTADYGGNSMTGSIKGTAT